MKNRILVKILFQKHFVTFKTISRFCRSPHQFYISRSSFEELEQKSRTIVRDIYSFAELYRDVSAGTVTITFTWLSGDEYNLSGRCETIVLPYDKLKANLMTKISDDSSFTWKALSIDNSGKRPKLMFKSKKNLHNAIANKTIRHKLALALCNEFQWPFADAVELYDDFVPYSFVFTEIENGKHCVNGGLIFHCHESLAKAYYSLHT